MVKITSKNNYRQMAKGMALSFGIRDKDSYQHTGKWERVEVMLQL
jgi:hypothetical protein